MKNDGGPAFPREGAGWAPQFGMSLRDWFAGQALSGLLGAPDGILTALSKEAGRRGQSFAEVLAIHSFKHADAVLAEREKEEK